MRAPLLRASFTSDDIIADNFAGGGGATEGIYAALGRPVDIAINHDAAAIAMHAANHPETRHYQEDIWTVDPRVACGSRRVFAAWFSPDCTHFSKAKGTQPRKKEIRALANVVIWWAETVRPRIIFLENVEEFQTWGPLDDHGHLIKSEAGKDFRAWLACLSDLGYRFEYKVLSAADYGAPTTRKRLFLIARCDNLPIVWPAPTHGPNTPNPYHPAADCIDWSLPCPSIFDRKRPLKPATLKRIAHGLKRFVLGQKQPFIVRHGHYSNRTGAGIIEGKGAGTFRGQPLTDPLATICATNDKSLVIPKLQRIEQPFLATYYGQSTAHPIDAPIGTVTTNIHHALVAPIITKHYGGPNGHVTPGSDARTPLSTVTVKDHHALTVAFLTKFYGTSVASDIFDPPSIVPKGGNHLAEVRALLTKYEQERASKPRQLELGEYVLHPNVLSVEGEQYEIVDVGMRMLEPHELFAAQGFRRDYVIDPVVNGKKITKTKQVALAGNSVCPGMAHVLVQANVFVQ